MEYSNSIKLQNNHHQLTITSTSPTNMTVPTPCDAVQRIITGNANQLRSTQGGWHEPLAEASSTSYETLPIVTSTTGLLFLVTLLYMHHGGMLKCNRLLLAPFPSLWVSDLAAAPGAQVLWCNSPCSPSCVDKATGRGEPGVDNCGIYLDGSAQSSWSIIVTHTSCIAILNKEKEGKFLSMSYSVQEC